jgi:hypothetical protein
MIEYVVAAWVSNIMCSHRDAPCYHLGPQQGIEYIYPMPDGENAHFCVENTDREIGANVSVQFLGGKLRVMMPPHVHPCKVPTS